MLTSRNMDRSGIPVRPRGFNRCIVCLAAPVHHITMPKTQDNYTLHYRFEGITLKELNRIVKEIKGIIGIKPLRITNDQNIEVHN